MQLSKNFGGRDLVTMDGSVIKVQTACIEVSSNRLSETGWYADVKIKAILPRGHKPHILSYSPSHNRINLMPLFGNAKWVAVDPKVYLDFLRSLPVVSSTLFPVGMTSDISAAARATV